PVRETTVLHVFKVRFGHLVDIDLTILSDCHTHSIHRDRLEEDSEGREGGCGERGRSLSFHLQFTQFLIGRVVLRDDCRRANGRRVGKGSGLHFASDTLKCLSCSFILRRLFTVFSLPLPLKRQEDLLVLENVEKRLNPGDTLLFPHF
ncbi:hypothetical protein PMAYCL1PPCAC_20721, partial [Pristionchus mayeri]